MSVPTQLMPFAFQAGSSGGPGRPVGSIDKIPRSFKASIKKIFREIGEQKPELYRRQIETALNAPDPRIAFPYIKLAAEYLDGKPTETVKLDAHVTGHTTVIHEHIRESTAV